MKSKKIIILLSSLLPAFSTVADSLFISSEILPYFRVDSGWSQFQQVKGLKTFNSTGKLKSDTNTIVGAGIGLGINFGDKIRSDFTWSRHLQPKLHSKNSTTSVERKPLIDAYFLNLYYETGIQLSIFNPYIGVGAGVAKVKDKLSISVVSKSRAFSDCYLIKHKNNFAYKFILGSAFDLNERIKFDLSYNYHDYGKTKAQVNSRNKQIGKTQYRAHIVSAGIRLGM